MSDDNTSTDANLNAWFDWRGRMRKRHRTMTIGEYIAWTRGGDLISDPTSNDSFPGGLTITLAAKTSIIGKVDDWEEPPAI